MYQVPRPRSGAQMIIHGPDDSLYIYGGYSKEKMAGLANAGASSQKNEGKVHEDMWFINLKQVITADTTNKIGKHVHYTRLTFEEFLFLVLLFLPGVLFTLNKLGKKLAARANILPLDVDVS